MSGWLRSRSLTLFAAALAALLGALGADAQSLAGRWSGPVSQELISSLTPNSFYPTVMTLDGTGAGTIDYPTLGCGGTLHFVGTSGSGFAYRERLGYGNKGEQRRCVDGGTIIVTPRGDSLHWSWSGIGILASGILFGQTRILEVSCQTCGPTQLHSAEVCTRSGDMFDQNRCLDGASIEWHKCLSTCRH